jgi:MFS family permease
MQDASRPSPPAQRSAIDRLIHLQGLVLLVVLEPFLSQVLRSSTAFLATTIERAFDMGATGMGAISGAYSLGAILTIVPGGALVTRFGSKPVLIAAGAVMASGCVWFSVASSPAELMAARFVTGFGAGPLSPVALAILSASTSREEFRTVNGESRFFGRLDTIVAT